MEIKDLIRNTEERAIFYKKYLEEIYKDRQNFPSDSQFVQWFKELLRENKNFNDTLLKQLRIEKQFENENLNPPFFYKY